MRGVDADVQQSQPGTESIVQPQRNVREQDIRNTLAESQFVADSA